jgi:cytochrome P450
MDIATQAGMRAAARRIADLPGPRGWPWLGNLPQFDIPSLHNQLETWAAVHGPIYRLRFGTRNAVVVSQPALIASLLRDRPEGWSRLRSMETMILELGIDGVFAAEGEAWRRQRRLITSAFTPGQLKRYFPLIQRITERLKARLDQAAAAGTAIELQTMLMRFTVDVTCSLTFGADVNTLQRGGARLQEHIDKIFPKLAHRMNMPLPYWRWFTLPADRDFATHLAAGHAAVRGFIQAARERIATSTADEQSPANLLEAMLAARDADGSALTEAEVAGNVFTMLLAGEDTTANSLAWSLYLLHRHPEAWRAIIAEVDAALGPALIPATPEAASGLSTIESATNEAMRLHPVAPLSYLETNHPTGLAGLALPAGTFVICLMRCGAVDPATAPDAAAFNPARWQAPDNTPDRNLTTASMPFGAGPRICPGRYLAMLEMKMVLATIARNYELVEVGTATGAPPKETNAFTMYPAGLRMRITPRARMPLS